MQRCLTGLALVAPWVFHLSIGPSPNAWPLLLAGACGALLLARRLALTDQDIATAWLVAAACSAFIGLLQYLRVADAFSPWIAANPGGEAYANLRQRNQFASLTSIGLLALLWWAQRRRHALWVALAVLVALGNAASASRTGMLQLVLLALLGGGWGLWRNASQRMVLLAALLTYAVATWGLPLLAGAGGHGIWSRLAGEEPGCSSRLVLWRNVLHLIAQKPWLGWGWGELDYAHFITPYPGARFCEILDNAHNLPLHLAVELGVPVAVLSCGALGWLLLRQRPWREADPDRQMAWGVLAMIGLHSLVEYPLWYGPFQLALGLCVWLLWPGRTTSVIGATSAERPAQNLRAHGVMQKFTSRSGTLLTALLLMAALSYAAWDYHRISQIYLPPAQRAAAYQDNTLEKLRPSWLFRRQVQFAELSVTPLSRGNAEHLNALAKALLHYSPEARVVEKLIESSVLLGRDDEALFYLQRYRESFPKAYAQWVAGGNSGLSSAEPSP